ncbi:hypothetical protein CC80DRAFT_278126 [Byssothecium circinans]|uniref:Uncharacterized protein n=1 Tax=Byssothecium circinans TaxID=147558 RepID=A0A6A5T9R7_9PLEO|nr:hypothetical protein CC80DRAFT_278126 [Byssothecium circinans]
MCWITLSPKGPHHGRHRPHHHQHHHMSSARGSSVEEVVRIRHGVHRPRFDKVHIVTPSISVTDEHEHHHPLLHHHHHRHPHVRHMHPLHMHPLLPHYHHHGLHGPGKRRLSPTPPPPPPSRSPSSCPSPREPVYRTQIVEPRVREVQETTRIALREAPSERRDRGRLRRVAGYEVLGREVPWNWDCVSSVPSENKRERSEKKSGRGLKFPPFGSMDQWM